MESFYDREAGVAWGPITKQETLDDLLLRGKRKVDRRFTLNCNPTFDGDKEERFLQIMHKNGDEATNVDGILIISSDDEIEEPAVQTGNKINKSDHNDDSLNESDNRNAEESQYIDSLKEITTNTYDNSTLYNNLNDVDIVCSEVCNLHLLPVVDIQNRLPTPANLDEYTYDDILDLDDEKNMLGNRTNKSRHDDSLDQSDIKNNEEESQFMNSLKENTINIYDNSILCHNLNDVDIVCSEVINLHLQPDIQNRLPSPANLDEHAYVDSLDLEEEKNVLGSTEDLPSCSNSNHGTYVSQYCYTPEKDRSLSEAEHSQCFPDISQEIHEETRNNVSGNYLEDSSLLNDTIAEMERLLNEGLKTMPPEKYNNGDMESYVNPRESVTPRTSTNAGPYTPISNVPTINIIPSSEIKGNTCCNSNSTKGAIKKLPIKTFATKIPVAPIYVHNTKPFTKPALTPISHSKHNFKVASAPTSLKKRFKDIESPISVYIKNSGMTPLYKKITPSKPLTSNKKKSEKSTGTNKENSVIFPEVVYKPAKRAIITNCNDFKLPTKIESLIPQKPNVIKHEGRIGTDGKRKDCILVNKNLSDVNLTIDSNASLDSVEDISIRYAKRAYIK